MFAQTKLFNINHLTQDFKFPTAEISNIPSHQNNILNQLQASSTPSAKLDLLPKQDLNGDIQAHDESLKTAYIDETIDLSDDDSEDEGPNLTVTFDNIFKEITKPCEPVISLKSDIFNSMNQEFLSLGDEDDLLPEEELIWDANGKLFTNDYKPTGKTKESFNILELNW